MRVGVWIWLRVLVLQPRRGVPVPQFGPTASQPRFQLVEQMFRLVLASDKRGDAFYQLVVSDAMHLEQADQVVGDKLDIDVREELKFAREKRGDTRHDGAADAHVGADRAGARARGIARVVVRAYMRRVQCMPVDVRSKCQRWLRAVAASL